MSPIQVFFHLGVKDEALQFALGAGPLFTGKLSEDTEYVTTLIGMSSHFLRCHLTILAECVDEYANRKREELLQKGEKKIDSRLEAIVEAMFLKCFEEREFKQAIGMAIESMRLDIIQKAISLSGDQERELLQYCYQVFFLLLFAFLSFLFFFFVCYFFFVLFLSFPFLFFWSIFF